jgi:anthranilate synthase/phosphoribosyltransferase
MILLIDNYDSFVYNLAQYLGALGAELAVYRNDAITLDEVEKLGPSHIIISPGPGIPDTAGISLDLIERFASKVPILGVCLGHQAIGQVFGGKVIRAEKLMHGMVSPINHDGQGIFSEVPSPFIATRYHSLVVQEPLPECLEVSARTSDGLMMALRHREYPTVGVQFHPESVLTEHGHQLLRNFLYIEKIKAVDEQQSINGNGTMTIKGALSKVIARQNLSEDEAEATMSQIMAGKATSAQIGALLTGLRMKGESVSEIAGCARAMRQLSLPIKPKTSKPLVDTCGTGGDRSGTFNVSTTTAFVVAGAGQAVAKHGNRSISSRSGSADVLEALGVDLDLTPEQVGECIDQVGIGFLFAPKLHPAMKNAIGPRREMGARSIFNLLGPLTNPAGAQAQVLGVYAAELVEPMAKVLNTLGSKAAFVVHGAGGLDELTTTGLNVVSELRDGEVHSYVLDPLELGFTPGHVADLHGGSPEENAGMTKDILAGKLGGTCRDIVVLNSAAALVAGGKANSLIEGVRLANNSIDSGSALATLDTLIAFTAKCRQ